MAADEMNTQDPNVAPKAKEAPEKGAPAVDFPAAGPHARADLNDALKTPGAGMLSDPGPHETDAPGG